MCVFPQFFDAETPGWLIWIGVVNAIRIQFGAGAIQQGYSVEKPRNPR
jgi:hypothetical protein